MIVEEASNRELDLRPYEAKDIPRMIDVLMEYVPQLPNYKNLTMDRGRIEYLLKHNLGVMVPFAAWVLVDKDDVPQGGAAGFCVMSLMSKDLIADDAFMFIVPEYRSLRNTNMLLQAYIEWAIARGAKMIRASHTGGSFPVGTREYELFDALLRRQGFKNVGSVYHYEPERM